MITFFKIEMVVQKVKLILIVWQTKCTAWRRKVHDYNKYSFYKWKCNMHSSRPKNQNAALFFNVLCSRIKFCHSNPEMWNSLMIMKTYFCKTNWLLSKSGALKTPQKCTPTMEDPLQLKILPLKSFTNKLQFYSNLMYPSLGFGYD